MIDPFQNKMVDVAVATCTHSYYRLAHPPTLSCWYRPTAFGQSLKRLGWRLLGRRLPLGAGAAIQPFAEMRSLSIVSFARTLGTAAPGQDRSSSGDTEFSA